MKRRKAEDSGAEYFKLVDDDFDIIKSGDGVEGSRVY